MAFLPFSLYSGAWRLAPLFLKRNPRLREGWEERVVKAPLPRADLWIQAASVGEAFLAEELLKALAALLPAASGPATRSLSLSDESAPLSPAATSAPSGGSRPLASAIPPPSGTAPASSTTAIRTPLPSPPTILLTTNTSQGRGVLEKLAGSLPGLDIRVAYFPLDDPRFMRRAVAQVQPKTVVLLESEIWPGFLTACRKAGVASLLINGRMSARSLGRYLKLPKFFRSIAPDKVLAMSPDDGLRFARVFGPDRVDVMSNIKFDRLQVKESAKESAGDNPLAPLLATSQGGAPLAVLGSVRQEEEPLVLEVLEGLLSMRPQAVVGLFPRHMHRLGFWREILATRKLPFSLRSETQGPAKPGSVLLWDTFGEMGQAYGLARAAFVGGSLAPLGGQNFLEPLAAGLVPVIGPHWANFAWVGREIVDTGLVFEARDQDEVLARLLMGLDAEPDRDAVRARFEAYLAPRRGGARQAAALVAETLASAYHHRIPTTESETP